MVVTRRHHRSEINRLLGLMNPSLLTTLTTDERARLLDPAVPRRFARGDVLHLAGDNRGRVHLVRSGLVKLTARDFDGNETILGLGVAGELVGEAAAIDGGVHDSDAIALTDLSALSLDAAVLRDVLGRNPRASLAAACGLASRLRWLGDQARERASGDLSVRMAGRLLDLASLLGRRHGNVVEFDLPVSQIELGKLAGMCRESACKTIRNFKTQGLVDYERWGTTIRILRPDVLAELRGRGRDWNTVGRLNLATNAQADARVRRHS
jgi:CRP-like cAMP-binding protein